MSVTNYAPGDSILIRNIITHLKSQGVFDQFRKECISDVDTKPAYQNLCHRVDGQVSSYLSDIRWGPDLNKNQLRENIRKYVNECSFVESGINRIVDQLVNPRINTILVPKVEDIVYKFMGIRRPDEDTANENKESKSGASDKESVDTVGNQSDWSNHKSDSNSASEKDKSFDSKVKVENLVNENNVSSTTAKNEEELKKSPENIKTEQDHTEENSLDFNRTQEFDHDEKPDDSRAYSNIESDEENVDEDDDDLSPPFEIHNKSDVDVSVESDYSAEVFEIKQEPEQKIDTLETTANDNIERTDEGSIDGSAGNFSYPEAEKSCEATPSLDIPKTPTINYETSEDSDDTTCVKTEDGVASADNASTENRAEQTTCDVPDFDKIAQKIAEDNREEAKRTNEESDATANAGNHKPVEEEADKSKEKTERSSLSSDKRRKDSDKSSSSRSNDSLKDSRDKKHYSDRKKDKDRHRSDKHESGRSDKDRKSDKEHSGHERHKSSKDRDRSRKSEAGTDHEKNKENGAERKSSKHHDEKRSKDDKKKDGSSRSDKHSRHESKDDKRRSSGSAKHHEGDMEAKSKKGNDGVEAKKQPKNQCANEKLKSDRRSSDRDSNGPASTSNAGHSSHRSSSKSEREKHEKHSDKSKHSSSSHKSKKNSSSRHHRDSRSDKSASNDGKKSSDVTNGISSNKERSNAEHNQLEKMLESIHGAGEMSRKTHKTTNAESLKRRYKETGHEELVDVLNDKLGENIELRKPKIARNESEFGKVVKLRKEYKERMKLLQQQGKENATIADSSRRDLLPMPAADEFAASLKEKKNCVKSDGILASPFKEFQVNLSRVDECLPIINGRYVTNDKTINDRNNNDDGASMLGDDRQMEAVRKMTNSDIEDEDCEADRIRKEEMRRIDIEEIIGCRTKNAHITYRVDMDDVNVDRLGENKENVDGTSELRTNYKNVAVDDDFRYFEVNDTGYREEFRKFVEEATLALEPNQCLRNFSIELQYPKRYDEIFRTQLGATVQRCNVQTNNCDNMANVSLKYNSEIIDQKGEEKGIMMRIKMCPKSKTADVNGTPSKKRKKIESVDESESRQTPLITNAVADENCSSRSASSHTDSSHLPPVATVKRKTLGIKRKISNGKTNMTLNGYVSAVNEKPNTSNLSTVEKKNEANKLEDTFSDCYLDQIVSQNSAPDSLEINPQPIGEPKPEEKKKDDVLSQMVANSGASIIKTPKNQRRNSLIKNTGDQATKDALPKRTPSQTKCYYDSSDLYKPRPSFLLTTRRSRGLNSENK